MRELPATFTASANKILLTRETPPRFGIGRLHVETIPFADWSNARPQAAAAAVARVLQAIEDGETAPDGTPLVVADETSATLHPALVARLTDSEAEALGLPPATRLALNLRSSGLIHRPGFRIDVDWTRLGGVPVAAKVTHQRSARSSSPRTCSSALARSAPCAGASSTWAALSG